MGVGVGGGGATGLDQGLHSVGKTDGGTDEFDAHCKMASLAAPLPGLSGLISPRVGRTSEPDLDDLHANNLLGEFCTPLD